MAKEKSGTVRIDPEIIKRVKRVVIETEETITEFIETALKRQLDKIEKIQKGKRNPKDIDGNFRISQNKN